MVNKVYTFKSEPTLVDAFMQFDFYDPNFFV